jgi:hypothetical protein
MCAADMNTIAMLILTMHSTYTYTSDPLTNPLTHTVNRDYLLGSGMNTDTHSTYLDVSIDGGELQFR